MAYSTQKDFFHDFPELVCQKACVKLKTYDSAIDERSWAPDVKRQSEYLADLVACKPASNDADNIRFGGPRQSQGQGRGQGPGDGETGVGALHMHDQGIKPGDSLLQNANVTLGRLEELLVEKKKLQDRLNASEENLKISREENERIKHIMNRRFDENDMNDFYNKIQKLSDAGKLSKADEKDLLQFLQKMRDLMKYNEVLGAEKCYLQQLIEKLNLRCKMTEIKVELETSKDIGYLQNEVNTLRKEVCLLRKFEDEKLRRQLQADCTDGVAVTDIENIKLLIKERNSLREKLESFKDLEKHFGEAQKKLQEVDKIKNNLSSKGESQSNYIQDLEREMRRMQQYYESHERDYKEREDSMKLEDLRNELCRARNEANRCQSLQLEVNCLRKELEKSDEKLNEYDCQFKEIMCVVAELRGNGSCEAQDNCTQTCTDDLDCLAFFTCATLEEIIKEFEKRVAQVQNTNTRLSTSLQERAKSLEKLSKKVEKYGQEVSKTIKDTADVGKELDQAYDLVKSISDIQQKNQRLTNVVNNLNNKEKDDLIDDLRRRLQNCMDDKTRLAQALKEKGVEPHLSPTPPKPVEPSIVQPTTSKEPPAQKPLTKEPPPAVEPSKPEPAPEPAKPAKPPPPAEPEKPVPPPQAPPAEIEKPTPARKPSTAKPATRPSTPEPAPKPGPLATQPRKPQEQVERKSEINKEKQRVPEDRPVTPRRSGRTPPPARPAAPPVEQPRVSPRQSESRKIAVPGTVARRPAGKRPRRDEGPADGMDQYRDFLSKNAQSMAFNLQAGSDIEKELREILDAFVEECRYCLCQDEVPKSKFYAICYKILHHGLMTLTCKEMAYAHKKIYNASERLYPGYLCQMIITDLNASSNSLLKCCECKNKLCCSDSHEMLHDRATRLEREMLKAKQFLTEIRKQKISQSCEDEDHEDRNLTFRQQQSSPRNVKSIRTKAIQY